MRDARRCGAASSSRAALRRRRAGIARRSTTRSSQAAAVRARRPAQRDALDRAIATVDALPRGADARAAARRDRARRRLRAHDRARSTRSGCTCPAGTAPLPSTAMMLAVPARSPAARCASCARRRGRTARADPAVLVRGTRLRHRPQSSRSAARRRSRRWPTAPQSVPSVDKIFGPGNAWVTAAKQLVALDPDGAAIDMPAGPSEVLVIADDGARARVRRRRPAGAGRARRRLAGGAGHDVAALMRSGASTSSSGSCAALPRAAIIAAALAPQPRRSSWPDLATALEVSNRLRAGAPDPARSRPARAGCRACARRLGVPRRLDARGARRLLQRHQPRAADLRLCARLQRPGRRRLLKPHHGAGS